MASTDWWSGRLDDLSSDVDRFRRRAEKDDLDEVEAHLHRAYCAIEAASDALESVMASGDDDPPASDDVRGAP